MIDPIAQLASRHIEGTPSVLGCRRMPCGYANANYRLETSKKSLTKKMILLK